MSREALYISLSEYIKKHCGIVYSASNFFQLDARIDALKKQLGFKGDDELLRALSSFVSADLHMLVIDLATNNETFFFRDVKLWSKLQSQILPAMLQSKPALNVWSLACSTGQEIYSLMMCLDKIPSSANHHISFDAFDISPRVLKRAQSGIYTQLEVQRGLPIMDLQKYFVATEDNQWQIRKDWPNRIKFKEFNLMTGFYQPQHYDLIFCRNVLIYQDIEKRREIVAKLYQALCPGGILVLGNSENLISINNDLETVTIDGVVFFRKPDPLKDAKKSVA